MSDTDNRDSRAILAAASHEVAAVQIKAKHDNMLQRRDGAAEEIASVCHDAAEIAFLVQTVHSEMGGARFAHWWREQDMPAGWAAKYLRLAKTANRKALADKDQLRLIGVLPEPDTHNDNQSPRPVNPFAWIKWSGKIASAFKPMQIGSMDEADRFAALKNLEPIEKIIRELRGDVDTA